MKKSDRNAQPCPYVDCGSSDAFSYNEDGYGWCFSCKSAYPSKKETFEWAKETYPVSEREPPKDDTIVSASYEGIRGIDEDVAKLYKLQAQLNSDNEVVRYAFSYPNNVKYRNARIGPNEKAPKGVNKFWNKHDNQPIRDLFGPDFNSGSSKRLYLTEGEFDAPSLYQALGKTFPVKALPGSGINDQFIKHNFEYLKGFQELVYAGELDKAGRQAADRLFEVFPDKFWYVPLTKHKDANAFLVAGDTAELKWAALKPQRYTPENFFTSDTSVEKAITEENPYEYVPTGHSGWDAKLRGLVKGGITFIKAKRGLGKTELTRYFEMAMLKFDPSKYSESESIPKHEVTIALLHAEEQKSITYRAMATYELGVNVRTKDDAKWNEVPESKVIEAAKKAAKGERTVIFEMRSSDDPLLILDYVRMAATVYGADFIFVDHIQRLAYLSANGVDGATAMLTTIGSRMAQLCKELNIGVVFISQVNDDGRTKYAAALEEEAIICVQLDRDVENEDERVQNTTNFIIDKNRAFSRLGSAGSVFFDVNTMTLEEISYDV